MTTTEELRGRLETVLRRARDRTTTLTTCVDETDLVTQHSR